MAWDGTLTPPPMHNEKAKKKRKWVDNVPKQTHFHIHFFFCFSSEIDTGFFDEKAIGNRHQIVILDYYLHRSTDCNIDP